MEIFSHSVQRYIYIHEKGKKKQYLKRSHFIVFHGIKKITAKSIFVSDQAEKEVIYVLES